MPLNTEVDYNNVVIKGTVELGVKGERGLQGFKGDQGPPVPVAHELGDDPDLAVSQKLLTDSIADMEQGNEAAVMEAAQQAGLAGEYATIATEQAGIAASIAGESAQSAQAAGQYAVTATEQAGIAATKAGEASSSASDAASQAGLAADSEAAAEQAATIATTKADEASQSAQAAAQSATQAEETLDDKVDKVAGKSLVDDAEIAKLVTVQENATANRDDSENADKVHNHTIEQVAGLSDRLDGIDSLIGDVESVLIAINGEPTP